MLELPPAQNTGPTVAHIAQNVPELRMNVPGEYGGSSPTYLVSFVTGEDPQVVTIVEVMGFTLTPAIEADIMVKFNEVAIPPDHGGNGEESEGEDKDNRDKDKDKDK